MQVPAATCCRSDLPLGVIPGTSCMMRIPDSLVVKSIPCLGPELAGHMRAAALVSEGYSSALPIARQVSARRSGAGEVTIR